MKIGIPQEIMTGEGRVPLTPAACRSLIDAGHSVYVQKNAGIHSGYLDSEYQQAGVGLVDDAQSLYDSTKLNMTQRNLSSK